MNDDEVGLLRNQSHRFGKIYKVLYAASGIKRSSQRDFSKYGAGIWVKLRDEQSGMQLELNWYPETSRFGVPYRVGEGVDHIGFVVEDVKETYNELVNGGAQPTEIDPSLTQGWSAHVKDPDGIWIELFQLTKPS
jgi:catechol 2,3-dioxygenase-like lactoylglutathione lyase family enzyme